MRTPLLLVLAVMLSCNFTMPVEHIPPRAEGGRIGGQKRGPRRQRAVDRAMLDKNMSVMASLLSDELEYTNQFGEVLTKAQWLDNIESGKLKNVTFDHKVPTCTFMGRGGAHRNQPHDLRVQGRGLKNSQAFHAVFCQARR